MKAKDSYHGLREDIHHNFLSEHQLALYFMQACQLGRLMTEQHHYSRLLPKKNQEMQVFIRSLRNVARNHIEIENRLENDNILSRTANHYQHTKAVFLLYEILCQNIYFQIVTTTPASNNHLKHDLIRLVERTNPRKLLRTLWSHSLLSKGKEAKDDAKFSQRHRSEPCLESLQCNFGMVGNYKASRFVTRVGLVSDESGINLQRDIAHLHYQRYRP